MSFNNMFGRTERPYCKHCATRIGRALAKGEGMEYDKNPDKWHERGRVALHEVMIIIRDTDMEHDDE